MLSPITEMPDGKFAAAAMGNDAAANWGVLLIDIDDFDFVAAVWGRRRFCLLVARAVLTPEARGPQHSVVGEFGEAISAITSGSTQMVSGRFSGSPAAASCDAAAPGGRARSGRF
jgi:hypothetical protein